MKKTDKQTTTIEQLKAMPVGSRVGGFTFVIKHTKKTMNPNGNQAKTGWMQQVIFMDKTGDMLADVFIDKYSPLRKGQEVTCIVTEIRDNYTKQGDKLLYVDQFTTPSMTADEFEAGVEAETEEWAANNDKVNRGKVRHGLSCAFIRAYGNEQDYTEVLVASTHLKDIINEWTDFIMSGD